MMNSNAGYSSARLRVMKAHADRIEGNAEGLVLVICAAALSADAKNALEKSFAALGYGPAACSYANVEGMEAADMFDIVEGIDPVALVAADSSAATLYGTAVAEEFPIGVATRVFGHTACAFQQLNDQLSTPGDKQLVWHLLKSFAL